MRIKRDGKSNVARSGDSVIIPVGVAHSWGNPFDEPAIIAVTLRPALRMETFFETFFGLAADGRINPRTGLPSFLQFALLAHDFSAEIQAPGLGGAFTRGLAAVVAPLARARGYRSVYPRYSEDAVM